MFYDEPSSYNGFVDINNSTSSSAIIEIPEDAGGKTIHIVLQVSDDGTPNLYAYRRIILTVSQ